MLREEGDLDEPVRLESRARRAAVLLRVRVPIRDAVRDPPGAADGQHRPGVAAQRLPVGDGGGVQVAGVLEQLPLLQR